MIIREMKVTDIEQVVAIENDSYVAPWTAENFINELSNQDVAYNYVLEKDLEIIGYGGFYLLFEDASINKVTIKAQYRGKKLGELLLNDLIARIKLAKCQRVILEVRVSNKTAQNLYFKNDFKEISRRKGYYSDGEDAIILERVLTYDNGN